MHVASDMQQIECDTVDHSQSFRKKCPMSSQFAYELPQNERRDRVHINPYMNAYGNQKKALAQSDLFSPFIRETVELAIIQQSNAQISREIAAW